MVVAAIEIVTEGECGNAHHFLIPEPSTDGMAEGTCIFCNTKRTFNTRYTDPAWGEQQMKFGSGRRNG